MCYESELDFHSLLKINDKIGNFIPRNDFVEQVCY